MLKFRFMVTLPVCGVPPRPVPLNEPLVVARLLKPMVAVEPLDVPVSVAPVLVPVLLKDTETVVLPDDGVVIERTAQKLLSVSAALLIPPATAPAGEVKLAERVLLVPLAVTACAPRPVGAPPASVNSALWGIVRSTSL